MCQIVAWPLVYILTLKRWRVLRYLYKYLNQFYNFKGLHSYKEKFHPRWELPYFVYPSLVALPEVVVALIWADCGDRLWDYLKPDTYSQNYLDRTINSGLWLQHNL